MEITETGIKLTRLYTGDDGDSHLETVTYAMKPARNGLVSDPLPVTGMTLRIWHGHPPVHDYHNTTRRQLVIHLAGEVKVETSDGANKQLGVGSILVSENVAPGMGHKSHELSQPRLQLLLPFADGFLDIVDVEPIEPESDTS